MKGRLRKRLGDYRLILLDMDGTLYYQFPLRLCMGIELMFYYTAHIHRIRELFMLRRFRKSYENGILERETPLSAYWMGERPLRYITLFRDRKLLLLVRRLKEQGAKIGIYSDYPVGQKIRALGIPAVDYCFCAADDAIQCLKPDPRGLQNILRITGESAETSLFIGDRYEKDGICAEAAGVDYIILGGNPLSRSISLYRKELRHV